MIKRKSINGEEAAEGEEKKKKYILKIREEERNLFAIFLS